VAEAELAVIFPSEPWVKAVVEAANRHPDLPRALAGLGGDLAAVVEREGPRFPRSVAVWGRQAGGRIAEWRVLDDEDDVLELDPAYVVRAPFGTWRQILDGRVDPVKAALSGRVRVKGDLDGLVRRATYRYILDEAIRSVPTEFPDEVGG
jgi:hypothetical protein